jgi:hypothetical protein
MSTTIDGMDNNKSKTPHIGGRPKEFEGKGQWPTHLLGILSHNGVENVFRVCIPYCVRFLLVLDRVLPQVVPWPDTMAHDCNMVIHVLHEHICKFQEEHGFLPEVCGLQ